MSILILIGVILMVIMLCAAKHENCIKIKLAINESEKVEISDYIIVPGYENEYFLSITTDNPGSYDLNFSFIEKGNTENVLKEHFYVLIEYDGEVYYDDKLSNLYERTDITIEMNLKRVLGTEVRIVYYIPSEVGNDIQGEIVDFDLFVTATEKRD